MLLVHIYNINSICNYIRNYIARMHIYHNSEDSGMRYVIYETLIPTFSKHSLMQYNPY